MIQERSSASLSVYELSGGIFARGLSGLKTVLSKGEAHATATGTPPNAWLEAQLAPDMNNLAAQVHWASEGAKLAMARLLGTAGTVSANDAKTFAELQHRIDATIAHLGSLATPELEVGLTRVIEIEHRGGSKMFSGGQFLVEFAIPNFFFHVTSAYAILRHEGVELSKGDLLGRWG